MQQAAANASIGARAAKLGALCCWPRSTGHGLAAWASAPHLPHYLPAAAHAPAGSAAFVALPPPQARRQTLSPAPSSQQHRCALVALRMRAAFAAAAADASLSSVPAGVALRCVWLHPVSRRRFRRRGSGMACGAAQPCALAEDWEVMPDGTKSQCMRCAVEAACCECRFKLSMPHSAGAHQTLLAGSQQTVHAGTAASPSISCPQQPTVTFWLRWRRRAEGWGRVGHGQAAAVARGVCSRSNGRQGAHIVRLGCSSNQGAHRSGTSRQPGSPVAAGCSSNQRAHRSGRHQQAARVAGCCWRNRPTATAARGRSSATVQQQGAPTEASENGHLLVRQPVQVGTDRAAACLVGGRSIS